jgi:hypothetical protein
MASGNHKMTIKTGIRGESVNNLGQSGDKVPAQQQSALPWHGMLYYRPRERGALEEGGKEFCLPNLYSQAFSHVGMVQDTEHITS